MESHGVRQPLESALAIQVEALVNLQVLMQQCVSGQQLLRSPRAVIAGGLPVWLGHASALAVFSSFLVCLVHACVWASQLGFVV